MIVVILGLAPKTGKTTVAVNLAVNRAHRKEAVTILDCEPDTAAEDWQKMRHRFGFDVGEVPKDACQIDVVAVSGDDVKDAIDKAKPDYDHIIIDVGAQNKKAMRSALLVADSLYTPIQLPKIYGDMLMFELAEIVRQGRGENPRLRAYAFDNRSIFVGKTDKEDIAETVDLVSHFSGFISDWPIHKHEIFKQSSRIGLGINEIPIIGEDSEIRDRLRARDELAVLENHIFQDEPFMYPKGHIQNH